MMGIDKTQRAFASLLGILISLCIISFLCYYAFKLYWGQPSAVEKQVEAVYPEAKGENPYTTLINSTQQQVDELNKRIRAKEKRWDDML